MGFIKRTLSLILVCCLFCLLIGCGSQTNGVSQVQLKEDIKKSTILQNCFTSNFVRDSIYSYVSHDIIKRQTNIDSKEDIIFCNIIAENQYFSVSFKATLEYVYYDEGGWILESSKITEKDVTPIAPADKDLVIDFLFSGNGYNIAYVKLYKNTSNVIPTLENCYNGEINIKEDNNKYLLSKRSYYTFEDVTFDAKSCCTLLSADYKIGEIIKASGNFRLFFDKKQGWTFLEAHLGNGKGLLPVFEINNAQFDYSKAIGDFGYKYDNGKTLLMYSINKIDVENEYVYYMEKSNQVGHTGEMLNRDSEIDLLTATIVDENIYYSLEDDAWIEPPFWVHDEIKYIRIK